MKWTGLWEKHEIAKLACWQMEMVGTIAAEEIEIVMKTSSFSPNFKAHTVLYE